MAGSFYLASFHGECGPTESWHKLRLSLLKAKQIGPQAIKWQEKTEHKQEGKASTQDR